MKALTLLGYGLKNGRSLLFGKKEFRMLCIPGAFLDNLRNTPLQDLTAAGVEKPFLTDNDLLVAWWTRIALSHLPPSTKRPVTVQVAMSLRRSLENDLLDPEKPYISNCRGFTNLLLPARGFKQKPVGETAARVRAALDEQRTREQIEAYEALLRSWAIKVPVFFGSCSTYQVSYTNWTRANLFGADFSAAAVKPRGTPLYPSYIANSQVPPYQFPEGFIIVGKGSEGNTWLCGYRIKGLWDKVEEELEAMKDGWTRLDGDLPSGSALGGLPRSRIVLAF